MEDRAISFYAVEKIADREALNKVGSLEHNNTLYEMHKEEMAMQYQRGYIDGFKEGKATFEPKTGHREYNDIYDHYLCGNCNTVVMDYDNFCPNCGYRLVESQERSDK